MSIHVCVTGENALHGYAVYFQANLSGPMLRCNLLLFPLRKLCPGALDPFNRGTRRRRRACQH